MHLALATIYQDKKTGNRVKQVGGSGDSEGFILVQANVGPPYYAALARLLPCDEAGNPDFEGVVESPADVEDRETPVPEPVIGVFENRININSAPAEEITRHVPGITYRTAKAIKSAQSALPGEVFRSLDQVKAAAPRVNWEAVVKANKFFIG